MRRLADTGRRGAVVASGQSPGRDGRRRPRLTRDVRVRCAQIQIFLCDVDGVLTDATVSLGPGLEFKRFCVRDGLAQRFLREAGIKVGWISNRFSAATAARAEELAVDYLVQERVNKAKSIATILGQAGLDWSAACFVGDDVVDLGALRRAGLAVAVQNAVPEVKAVSHYVTVTPGGYGAVREVVELILQAQGRWDRILESYAE